MLYVRVRVLDAGMRICKLLLLVNFTITNAIIWPIEQVKFWIWNSQYIFNT